VVPASPHGARGSRLLVEMKSAPRSGAVSRAKSDSSPPVCILLRIFQKSSTSIYLILLNGVPVSPFPASSLTLKSRFLKAALGAGFSVVLGGNPLLTLGADGLGPETPAQSLVWSTIRCLLTDSGGGPGEDRAKNDGLDRSRGLGRLPVSRGDRVAEQRSPRRERHAVYAPGSADLCFDHLENGAHDFLRCFCKRAPERVALRAGSAAMQ
jgi:hypothetical protein